MFEETESLLKPILNDDSSEALIQSVLRENLFMITANDRLTYADKWLSPDKQCLEDSIFVHLFDVLNCVELDLTK